MGTQGVTVVALSIERTDLDLVCRMLRRVDFSRIPDAERNQFCEVLGYFDYANAQAAKAS